MLALIFAASLVITGFALSTLLIALRPTPMRIALLLGRTLETSSQLPIRIAVLLVVLLVWVASRLGLDVLLGAFIAFSLGRRSRAPAVE